MKKLSTKSQKIYDLIWAYRKTKPKKKPAVWEYVPKRKVRFNMESMSLEDLRRAWVEAVVEGRLSTADFLMSHVPDSLVEEIKESVKGIPDTDRNTWRMAGEL